MGGGLIMEQYVCIGCGATIQTEDPKGTGYTPQSALNKMLKVKALSIANVVLDSAIIMSCNRHL